VRPFLFIPEIANASAVTFSADFAGQGLLGRKATASVYSDSDTSLASLQSKLAALRQLSTRWTPDTEKTEKPVKTATTSFDEDEEELDEELEIPVKKLEKKAPVRLKNVVGKPVTAKIGKPLAKSNKVAPSKRKPLPAKKPIPKQKAKPKAPAKITKPRKKSLRPLPRIKREAKIASMEKPKSATPKTAEKKTPKQTLAKNISTRKNGMFAKSSGKVASSKLIKSKPKRKT
jgi:hypothetical protein